ncbi:protein-glutamate methylesterase/protein-glutamine glutaminase [Anaerovorax odorimutans]|uniref:protein-glutamate methylesterase/protein-glutamine glutaminase n=1 Tax=Anaerovorax odorimutans TaxID=109327 RepID=UPI0004112188|nr:chemotaxis response regulator protein-glutamate methylesterase [Anaerovorax odorimutans]
MKKVKVLVVDDSILFRKVLIDRLSQYDHIEVVGYATDAFDAQDKIPKLDPHVVTLDVEMPKLNGIEFLKKMMPKRPLPVVLVSSLNISVFEALSAGAVDFVRKPSMQAQNAVDLFISELVRKISIASVARVKTSNTVKAQTIITSDALKSTAKSNSIVIAIGASTGGTEATLTVLKNLPANTPGILVTQHMPPGFTKMYAERLNKLCAMEVKEAQNGDKVIPGRVLIAPGDAHMRLTRTGNEYFVRCAPGEKVSGHCPSVDVLFDSVASVARGNSVGIIMTGMGKDGAAGLLNMKKQGAYTIGQSKESCVVYGMPMVAKNIGAVATEAPCEEIASILKQHLNKL